MKTWVLVLGLFLSSVGGAQSKVPGQTIDFQPHFSHAPQSVPSSVQNKNLVHESMVKLNGNYLRQVEFDGKFYLLSPEPPESFLSCQYGPVPTISEKVLTPVPARSKDSLVRLAQKCDQYLDRMKTQLDLGQGRVGLKKKGDKPDSSEKKIFINPFAPSGGVGTSF